MRLLLQLFLSVLAVAAREYSSSKLTQLRSLFSSDSVRKATGGHPISAYILPKTDAHQSEWLADFDSRVRFLSNFTGSNAYVIVTKREALLWTDNRYFIQAEQQLSSEWTLMKYHTHDPYPTDWLIANMPPGSYVGFDPELFTYGRGEKLLTNLDDAELKAVPIGGNLVDKMWKDRPDLPHKQLIVLSDEETGKSVDQKLSLMRRIVANKKCTASVYAALDDIMWLLNVRGGDIRYNPLAYSYLLITQKKAHLFIDKRKLNPEVRAHLSNVAIHPYEDATNWLKQFHKIASKASKYQMFVPTSTNYAIASIFEDRMVLGMSPASSTKTVKNEVEIQGMRNSHIRDSALEVEFLYWLEQEIGVKGKQYTEIQVAEKINELRASDPKFVDLSFGSSSAAGENAGLPHYRPHGHGRTLVTKDKVYLLDSGAHYRDGTTDVTRTVWLANRTEIPEEFILHNTLVLKGHIDLAKTIFPRGSMGMALDSLARKSLWKYGLDYGHGTGHGVGHFLNVHEAPAGIYDYELKERMVITIEPGYYLEGKWGIRIENSYEVLPAEVFSEADNYITFRSLTLVPIEMNIVEKSLLDEEEIAWLNEYHGRVLTVIGPILLEKHKMAELDWLTEKCRAI